MFSAPWYLILVVTFLINSTAYSFHFPLFNPSEQNPASYLTHYEQFVWHYIKTKTTLSFNDCLIKAHFLEKMPTGYRPRKTYPLPDDIIIRAQQVAADFGLCNVTFLGSSDAIFAFTVRSTIYLDLDGMTELGATAAVDDSSLFDWIIAHELIHLQKKDSLILCAFRTLMRERLIPEESQESLCSMLSHFMEFRADIMAAIQSPHYLRGYYLYTHHAWHETVYGTLPSHPAPSERKKLSLALGKFTSTLS